MSHSSTYNQRMKAAQARVNAARKKVGRAVARAVDADDLPETPKEDFWLGKDVLGGDWAIATVIVALVTLVVSAAYTIGYFVTGRGYSSNWRGFSSGKKAFYFFDVLFHVAAIFMVIATLVALTSDQFIIVDTNGVKGGMPCTAVPCTAVPCDAANCPDVDCAGAPCPP